MNSPSSRSKVARRLLRSRRMFFLALPLGFMLGGGGVLLRWNGLGIVAVIILFGSYYLAFFVFAECPHCGKNFYVRDLTLGNPLADGCVHCGKNVYAAL